MHVLAPVVHQGLAVVHPLDKELNVLGAVLANHDGILEAEVQQDEGGGLVGELEEGMLDVAVQDIDVLDISSSRLANSEPKTVEVSLEVSLRLLPACLKVGVDLECLQPRTAVRVEPQSLLRYQLITSLLLLLSSIERLLHIVDLLVYQHHVVRLLRPERQLAEVHQSLVVGRELDPRAGRHKVDAKDSTGSTLLLNANVLDG
mmetsp:Transcript_3825/g.9112  ORF Transcript_3825/g.9112 Transcript_3825/m.9112 type:complete len:203 (-) Transcript_3825:1735-2343(-)